MSDMGRVRGGGVITQCTGLLMDGGAWGLLNSGAVSSTLECTTVVSTSLTECMGTATGLSVAERNQGRSLTKSTWLIWDSASLKVVSTCLVILTCWSFCSLVILAYWSSCSLVILVHQSSVSFHHSSLLVLVSPRQSFPFEEQFPLKLNFGLGGCCNCLRAVLSLIASSVWEPTSWWGREGTEGTDSGTGLDKWGPSSQLSQRASLRNGMTIKLSPSFSHGRTWVEEYRSNWHSCSHASGNWAVEMPAERVVTSR